ncbi:hypothetical protein NIES4073_02830 (plasmid) [Kalymmatonema gypsitolerans NIES-4073]|nr:hypothetical protein NIES4073_02830 [Scytonema sp. NIES-4073]
MDTKGFHIRDKIDLTQVFIQQLPLAVDQNPIGTENFQAPARAIAYGKTLTFIAREIVSPGGFAIPIVLFRGYDLVLIADIIHLQDVLWVTANPSSNPSDSDGFPDPPGEAEEGRSGHKVTIICRNLHNISVWSEGGKGGIGSQGAEGEDGIKNCISIGQDGHPHCTDEKSPGKGFRGKPGAKGGVGGEIILKYVNDLIPGGFDISSLISTGGTGGDPGPGGLGGCTLRFLDSDPEPVFRDCSSRGDTGDFGVTGPVGDPTPATALRISEADYQAEVRSQLANVFDDVTNPQEISYYQKWIEHRLQSAEYYFRTFNPSDPNHSNNLSLALTEAKAVLQLDPFNEQAEQYKTFIEKNLNILGKERDLSLIPDFLAYNQTLINYGPQIRQLFEDASELLRTVLEIKHVKDVLNTRLTELELELNSLGDVQKEAKIHENNVKNALDSINDDIRFVDGRINELELELTIGVGASTGIGFSDVLPIFAGVVVPVLANVVAPGSGIVAGVVANSLIAYATDSAGNPGAIAAFTSNLDTILQNTSVLETKIEELTDEKGIENYMQEYKDLLQGSSPDQALVALQDKLKNDWGSNVTPIVSSFSKIIQQLKSAQITEERDPVRQNELIQRYQELAALKHQEMQTALRYQQAIVASLKAEKVVDAAKGAKVNVQGYIGTIEGNEKLLREAALSMLRSAQAAQTTLLTYHFAAVRALQIYTLAVDGSIPYVDLTDNAGRVAYAYGFISPEIEAEFLDEVGFLADPKSFTSATGNLIAALSKSIETIESLNYQRVYDNYIKDRHQQGGPYTLVLDITKTPEAIEQFKASKILSFLVDLDDMIAQRPERYDTKVTGISLKFIGIESEVPLTCKVSHNGRSVQRRLSDKKDIHQFFNRSEDLINITPPTYVGRLGVDEVGNPIDTVLENRPHCWGRGVATEWTVELEDKTVDLATLEEIKVFIHYSAFYDNSQKPTSVQNITHFAGAIQPGVSALGQVALLLPAPPEGMIVKIASSDANLVKVSNVIVPAGATTATFPMQIADSAAGKTVTLTATGDYTLETRLGIPAQTTKQSKPLGTKAGYHANVLGIAVDEQYIWATHYYSKIENGHESFGAGELVVLDGATLNEVNRISVGYQPRSVTVNPLTKRIYVTNYGQESYSLSVINGETFQVIAELKLGQVPIDVAVNSKTNRIYVTNPFQRKIHVIDGNTNTELTSIQVGDGLQGLTIDEAANRIYVARSYRSSEPHVNAMTVIQVKNDDTYEVLPPIPIGSDLTQSLDIAVNPQTNRIYVANLGVVGVSPSVTVLDRTTYEVITTVKTIAGARAIAVNPGLNQVYIGTDSGVQIMDGATNSIVSTIPKNAPWGIAINPTTNQIYAGSATEGTLMQLAALDLSTITQWT